MDCFKHTGQDGRHVCNDLTSKVTMIPPLLGHATDIYGFISTYKRPIYGYQT